MREVLAVAIGGAIGASLRYGVGVWMARSYSGFPWSTMLVNLTGSFLIGVLMALSMEKGVVTSDWRLFLGTGVLGGFTTFSTLAFESMSLMQDGLWAQGFANAVVSCVAGLALAWLGLVVGRAL